MTDLDAQIATTSLRQALSLLGNIQPADANKHARHNAKAAEARINDALAILEA